MLPSSAYKLMHAILRSHAKSAITQFARLASTSAAIEPKTPSQPAVPSTSSEALQAVFDHEALIVTRKIEWCVFDNT